MDKNYPPLDFANVHGTAEVPFHVYVDATEPGFFTITGHPNPEFNGRFAQPDGTHSDTVKMSNCSWLFIHVTGRLIGGVEDCFDCNNGSHDVGVDATEWASGGLFVCTIKGGSVRVKVTGFIVKHGSEMDVDLGNWSDQNQARTKEVFIAMTSAVGLVRIRVLNAWPPTVALPASCTVDMRWKGIFEVVYKILKFLHLA